MQSHVQIMQLLSSTLFKTFFLYPWTHSAIADHCETTIHKYISRCISFVILKVLKVFSFRIDTLPTFVGCLTFSVHGDLKLRKWIMVTGKLNKNQHLKWKGEEKDTKTDKQKSLTIWKWKCPQTSFYLSRLWSKYKQIAFWTSGALEGALCWRSCNEVATAPSGRVNPQNPLHQTHCQQPRGKYETQFVRNTFTELVKMSGNTLYTWKNFNLHTYHYRYRNRQI